ncbi:MAG: hypothetical protein PVF49_02885 [Anaerolineales bacterium]|jgi:hypothetical protein
MKITRKLAFQLTAVYLILSGLMGLGLSFEILGIITAIVALAAGILLWITS